MHVHSSGHSRNCIFRPGKVVYTWAWVLSLNKVRACGHDYSAFDLPSKRIQLAPLRCCSGVARFENDDMLSLLSCLYIICIHICHLGFPVEHRIDPHFPLGFNNPSTSMTECSMVGACLLVKLPPDHLLLNDHNLLPAHCCSSQMAVMQQEPWAQLNIDTRADARFFWNTFLICSGGRRHASSWQSFRAGRALRKRQKLRAHMCQHTKTLKWPPVSV